MVFQDILITNKEQLLYKQTYSFFIHFCVLFFRKKIFFYWLSQVLCHFPCFFIFSFFLLYFLLPRETLSHYRAGYMFTLLISFFCFIHTLVLSLSLKISFKAIKQQNQHQLIPLLPLLPFLLSLSPYPLFFSQETHPTPFSPHNAPHARLSHNDMIAPVIPPPTFYLPR